MSGARVVFVVFPYPLPTPFLVRSQLGKMNLMFRCASVGIYIMLADVLCSSWLMLRDGQCLPK